MASNINGTPCTRWGVLVALRWVLLLYVPWLVSSFSVYYEGRRTLKRHKSNTHDRQLVSPLRSSPVDDPGENTWRSGIRTPESVDENVLGTLQDLCESTPCRPLQPGESGLAFLFVSQVYADSFQKIVETAHKCLGTDDTTLLSVVGGGVAGGGRESDNPTSPAMSLLHGILPSTANVEVFMFGFVDETPPPATSPAWKAIGRNQKVPSYVLFVDPWAPIQQVLDGLDASGVDGAVVAGGISCPMFGEDGPTVAINDKAYPRGSAVGVGLSGTIGLQAVVAQGCRPVGPAFGITEAQGNLILELDSKPAMEVLKEITQGEYLSEEDKLLARTQGLLCGLAAPGASSVETGDYLVREIIGLRPPAIVIGTEVEEGDVLRFHVRDPPAAKDDLRNMVERAKTERIFAGPQNAGTPLAAVQTSCVARGRSLFGAPNVDIAGVGDLLVRQEGEIPAVAGFFANGEIGPVGVSGVGLGVKQTHMHGFTAVAATICDFSAQSTASSSEAPAMNEEDLNAWG